MRVLSSPGISGGSPIPTLVFLEKSLPPDVVLVDFRWRLALFGRYDVLHIHWPEYVIRDQSGRVGAYKKFLFLALMARLWVTRKPSVWTVHNDRPHESGGLLENVLFRLWSRVVTVRVYMFRCALPQDRTSRSVFIRHGDYEPAFSSFRSLSSVAVPYSLCLFGVLRPYKGIEGLLSAFSDAARTAPRLSLTVSGEPISSAYGDAVTRLAMAVPRVSIETQRHSDRRLA